MHIYISYIDTDRDKDIDTKIKNLFGNTGTGYLSRSEEILEFKVPRLA